MSDTETQQIGSDPQKQVVHVYLQLLLSRKMMSLRTAKALYKKCQELTGATEENFFDFLHRASKATSFVGFDIVRGLDYEGKEECIVLANTNADDVSKTATELKPEELTLFRLILEKIMLAPHNTYTITWRDAIRSSSDKGMPPSYTLSMAESVLKTFLAKDMLHLLPSGSITLSTKTILELTPLLKRLFETEEETISCGGCRGIVLNGQKCPNAECQTRFHLRCQGKLGGEGICPTCQTPWHKNTDGIFRGVPIGPDAADLENKIPEETEYDVDGENS